MFRVLLFNDVWYVFPLLGETGERGRLRLGLGLGEILVACRSKHSDKRSMSGL